MGGGKQKLQTKAEETSGQASAIDQERAATMQDRLKTRREQVNVSEQRNVAQNAAVGQLETGDYDPTRMTEARAPAQRLAADTNYSGAGREGYQDFATTGGFNPGEKEQFLRRATAPTAAIYARSSDELNRQKALQGGYNPGFTASQARLTRGAAQTGAEASLGGNVALAEQTRQGRVAGLSGLERTRQASGQEQLDSARILGTFEHDIATGKQQALNTVTNLLGLSLDELGRLDQTEIQNRALAAGMSQQETSALLNIAGQKRSGFDYVAPFVQAAGAIGGAYAGRDSGRD